MLAHLAEPLPTGSFISSVSASYDGVLWSARWQFGTYFYLGLLGFVTI